MTENTPEQIASARRDDASRILAITAIALIFVAIIMLIMSATSGDLVLFDLAKTLLGSGLTGLLLWMAVLSVKR